MLNFKKDDDIYILAVVTHYETSIAWLHELSGNMTCFIHYKYFSSSVVGILWIG